MIGCNGNQNSKILGVECFENPDSQHFSKIGKQEINQYNLIKDSVFKLPHAPLHKVITAPKHKTFVGLYHNRKPSSVKQKLSESTYRMDQKKDTLGHHFLLKKNERMAYAFFYQNQKEQLLIFLNISKDPDTLKRLFTDSNYYHKQLACEK